MPGRAAVFRNSWWKFEASESATARRGAKPESEVMPTSTPSTIPGGPRRKRGQTMSLHCGTRDEDGPRCRPLDESERPDDRVVRRAGVGAEVAGLDGPREVMAKGGVTVADLLQRVLDPLCHRQPSPFHVRCRLAIPAAETDRGGQLLGEEIDLLAGRLRPPEIVEALGLAELVVQLLEAMSV